MIILAIDPSLSSTGYVFLDDKLNILCIDKICTKKNGNNLIERINTIVDKLNALIDHYKPDYIISEDGYIGANIKGSMDLAMLRGTLLGRFKNVIFKEPSDIRKELLAGNSNKKEIYEYVLSIMPYLELSIGPYDNSSSVKRKTSDMYDAIGIGLAFLKEKGIALNDKR